MKKKKLTLVQEVIIELRDYAGVEMNEAQATAFLKKHPDTRKDVERNGLDTCERECLMDDLARDLVGKSWPLNLDGVEYGLQWKKQFVEAATKAGYKVTL
jgi:hypothetical protein